jgi:hypothetical protein
MSAPVVLSFDLDDTLWAVEPVIMAAEAAMLSWLTENHPQIMRGHDRESLRAMRVAIAVNVAASPSRSRDRTRRPISRRSGPSGRADAIS